MIAGSNDRPQFVLVPYAEGTPFSDLGSGRGNVRRGSFGGTGRLFRWILCVIARGGHLVGVNSGTDSGLPLIAINRYSAQEQRSQVRG